MTNRPVKDYPNIFRNYLMEQKTVEDSFDGVSILPDHGLSCETICHIPNRNIFMVYLSNPILKEDWIHYYKEDGTWLHGVSFNPAMEAILTYSKLDKSKFLNKED